MKYCVSCLSWALCLLVATNTFAQLPQNRLTSVFPVGAQQGATVDVTVTGGSDQDELDGLFFSHPGIKATQKTDGNGNAIANVFTVSVDASVPLGLHDVRTKGLFGVSNPRIFRIDRLPEVIETEPNNANEQAQVIELNTVVNARFNGATDVDTYRIPAKANQAIVIRSEAARLDSLAQPVLELFDGSGHRVTESRRVLGQEALLVYHSKADQELILKVRDVVYGGSNDYVYRLSIDNRPVVDSVQPPVLIAAENSTVTLLGRHLQGGEATELTLNGSPLFKTTAKVNSKDLLVTNAVDSFSASIESA